MVSEKLLQDFLLNSEVDIIEYLKERNLSIPYDWESFESIKALREPSASVYQQKGQQKSSPIDEDEVFGISDDKHISTLAETEGRSTDERIWDNEEAKQIALDWLSQNGYDCKSHNFHFDKITNVRQTSTGLVFNVLISSVRRGKLFLRPVKWLELVNADTFLLVVGSEKKLRAFFTPQEVLKGYVRTLMRVKNDKIEAEGLTTMADLNSDVETMQFIFYNAEDKFDAELDQMQSFKASNPAVIKQDGFENLDILD